MCLKDVGSTCWLGNKLVLAQNTTQHQFSYINQLTQVCLKLSALLFVTSVLQSVSNKLLWNTSVKHSCQMTVVGQAVRTPFSSHSWVVKYSCKPFVSNTSTILQFFTAQTKQHLQRENEGTGSGEKRAERETQCTASLKTMLDNPQSIKQTQSLALASQ